MGELKFILVTYGPDAAFTPIRTATAIIEQMRFDLDDLEELAEYLQIYVDKYRKKELKNYGEAPYIR